MGGGNNKANSKQQTKLIKFIKTPLRILSRTRDFYIQSMTNCTGRMSSSSIMGCSTGPAAVSTTLPRSFSVNSSKPRNSVDDDLRDLIRVTSQKGTGLKDKVIAEILLLQQQQQQQQQQQKPQQGQSPISTRHLKSPLSTIPDGLPRSHSSSVVGIGRIDEIRPSDFEKAPESPVEPLLYPRSKSYGVSKMKTTTTRMY